MNALLNWFLAKYTKDMKELVWKEKYNLQQKIMWALQGEKGEYNDKAHSESE